MTFDLLEVFNIFISIALNYEIYRINWIDSDDTILDHA